MYIEMRTKTGADILWLMEDVTEEEVEKMIKAAQKFCDNMGLDNADDICARLENITSML